MDRIDVLPDDVLLEIFYFYVNMSPWREDKPAIEAWQSLVHVCRRWRSLVFESPRRLNLRLYCKCNTLERNTLDIWPALPLVIQADLNLLIPLLSDAGHIVAALGQRSRVCEVDLSLTGWLSEGVLAAMQVSFPELRVLKVRSDDEAPPVIPDSFLGGSAPRLLYFELDEVTFPELPKLHLSAPHLVTLTISYTHHSWHISSEAMVALLSGLSSLKTLSLEFESPDSPQSQDPRRPPPSKRSVIPALTSFDFIGSIEYLENLVTFIDAPRLDSLLITFFDHITVEVVTQRLAQFIHRTPALLILDEAGVEFDDETVSVGYRTSKSGFDNILIKFCCRNPIGQLFFIEQICNSMHPLSMVENLYIERQYQPFCDNDDIQGPMWLEFIVPSTAVKNLYISEEFTPAIAPALRELGGGRIADSEVLPSLQNIFVEPSGPLQENIEQFVAARQLSGHPIAISAWL